MARARGGGGGVLEDKGRGEAIGGEVRGGDEMGGERRVEEGRGGEGEGEGEGEGREVGEGRGERREGEMRERRYYAEAWNRTGGEGMRKRRGKGWEMT